MASGCYGVCAGCGLVFQHPSQRPDALTEQAIYAAHDNRPDDPDYRRFLSRLTRVLVPALAPGAEGLDYGAGPGPALAAMLAEAGFAMTAYDPFFAPHEQALARRYDFVVCTETAEHFHHPGREFDRLAALLRPGGHLGLMTRLLLPGIDFDTWHYPRDPTHVSFYTDASLGWLARRHGWRWRRFGPDVVLFGESV